MILLLFGLVFCISFPLTVKRYCPQRGEGGSVKRVHKGQHLNGLRDIVYYCNTPDQNVINSVALLGEESLLFILT